MRRSYGWPEWWVCLTEVWYPLSLLTMSASRRGAGVNQHSSVSLPHGSAQDWAQRAEGTHLTGKQIGSGSQHLQTDFQPDWPMTLLPEVGLEK